MLKPLPSPSKPDASVASIDDAQTGMDRVRAARRPWRLYVGVGAVVLLVLGGAATWLLSSVVVPIDRLQIGSVATGDLVIDLPLNAEVVPDETVFLDSVPGGRVVEVFAASGQSITAGAPILRIENTELELALIRQEASYAEQLSSLARTRIEIERSIATFDDRLAEQRYRLTAAKSLLGRQAPHRGSAVPEQDVLQLEQEVTYLTQSIARIERARADSARHGQANISQLERSLVRMRDSLDLARRSYERLTVSAPISGQLSSLTSEVGTVVAAGGRVGRIDRTETVKLRAKVDEFYLGRVEPGRLAQATFGNENVALTVLRVLPTVEDRQFDIEMSLPKKSSSEFRIGQRIPVRLTLGERKNVLMIPNGSYLDDTAGQWVFVVSADERYAVRKEIAVGQRTHSGLEVLAGLNPNDKIITSSYTPFVTEQRIALH